MYVMCMCVSGGRVVVVMVWGEGSGGDGVGGG